MRRVGRDIAMVLAIALFSFGIVWLINTLE